MNTMCLAGLAQQLRAAHVRRVINEQAGAVFDRIDQRAAGLRGHCRATLAASDIALRIGQVVGYILGSVHHDASVVSIVIDPSFHAGQFQGVAVLAFIGFPGNVKTGAAFVGRTFVGEGSGHFPAGIAAMGYQGIEEQLIVLHIQHKKPFLAAGQAEVDDGDNGIIQEFAFRKQLFEAFFGKFKRFLAHAFQAQVQAVVHIAHTGYNKTGIGGQMTSGSTSGRMIKQAAVAGSRFGKCKRQIKQANNQGRNEQVNPSELLFHTTTIFHRLPGGSAITK